MTPALVVELLVRWRANDPGEEQRVRWSKVHVRRNPHSQRTACGRLIPEFAYMEDNGPEVPGGAERCQACARATQGSKEWWT